MIFIALDEDAKDTAEENAEGSEAALSEEDSSDILTEEKRAESTGAKVMSILFTVFIYLLSAGIIIAALLFAFNVSPDKSIFGYRYYTVLTGSMAPSYNTGDMIFVQIVDPETIEVNDVITFNPSKDSDAYLTHRVSEKIENYMGSGITCFRTKGDSNNTEDGFLIEGSRIIGVVRFKLPGFGYVVRFCQLRWYYIVPVLVMIAVFLHLLKKYFLMENDDGEDDDDDDNGDDKEQDDRSDDTEEVKIDGVSVKTEAQ